MSTFTYAADSSCPIKEQTPKVISKYITNLDTAVDTLLKETADSVCKTSTGAKSVTADTKYATDSITKYVNRGLSEDNPIVSGQFWIDNIVKGEVPYGVNRDLALLKNKQDKIYTAFDQLAAKCALDLPATVSGYNNNGEYLGAILENHVNIMRAFKQAAVGDPYAATQKEYLLVEWTSFETDLSAAYGPKAAAQCRKNEDFFKKISEAFDRFGQGGGSLGKGVQIWKDAWKLLKSDDKQSREKERELLRRELSNQGLSQNSARRIMRNLDSFNQKDEHRGITGFAEDIGNSIAKVENVMMNAYASMKAAIDKSKSTDEYVQKRTEYKSLSVGVGKELAGDYEKFKASLWDPSLISDENLSHLIDTHVTLKETGETLAKYGKVSTEACNSVSPGQGSCKGE